MPRKIFVTGATGYIAKHIVLQALREGHSVVGSTRYPGRESDMRAALQRHLPDATALSRLRLVRLDMTADDGWDHAMAGCDALLHTATPVPVRQPRNPDEVLRPALEGTKRALRAARAAGIGQVVLTSSSSAISGGPPPESGVYDETCWSDPDDRRMKPYARAKTLAERAAWDFVAHEAPEMTLTAINPVVVVGPPLDADYSASIHVIARLLSGRDPLLPRLGVTLIDVRDVAEAHLAALDRPEAAAGKRIYLHDRFLWLREIAEHLREACPDRRIARREAPDMLIRVLALFDRELAHLVPSLGQRPQGLNARARELLERDMRDTRDSLGETARILVQEGWT